VRGTSLLHWSLGLVANYRYPTDRVPCIQATSQDKERGVHPRATMCPTVPDPAPPAKVGIGAAMCLPTPELASLIGRATMLPRVPWPWTHWEGSGAPRVLWLRIVPPCWESSGLPRVLRFPVGHGSQT
jgi:hypothetical protein